MACVSATNCRCGRSPSWPPCGWPTAALGASSSQAHAQADLSCVSALTPRVFTLLANAKATEMVSAAELQQVSSQKALKAKKRKKQIEDTLTPRPDYKISKKHKTDKAVKSKEKRGKKKKKDTAEKEAAVEEQKDAEEVSSETDVAPRVIRTFSDAARRRASLKAARCAVAKRAEFAGFIGSKAPMGRMRSPIYLKNDLDGYNILSRSQIKKMLRSSIHFYKGGGHFVESASLRERAAGASLSRGALNVITCAANSIFRSAISSATLATIEAGKTRITCSALATAFRPLDAALDLRIGMPPNAIIASARVEGVLDEAEDERVAAAQRAACITFKNAVHNQ